MDQYPSAPFSARQATWTIFAPTDAAFEKFTSQQHERVKNTPGLLVQVGVILNNTTVK